MPEARQLHQDQALTNLSLKYRNEAMIWPNIMPLVKVQHRSDKYYVYNKQDSYQLPDDKIGPKSYANEYDWGVATQNYSVRDHALADWVTVEEIENADNPLAPEVDSNEFLNLLLDIAQESRVATKVFTSGNYAAGNTVTLSGTSQWGQSADDPIGSLLTAIETCFLRANTIVMGVDVWLIFRKLPEILDAVKGSTRYQTQGPGGLATVDEVKGLFEVDNWYIGRGRYNTAKPGQTPTYARLWGKHVAALHIEPEPSVKTVTFGVTFAEMLRATYTEFDGKRGIKGANYIKVAWNSDEEIIANDLGYMIVNAVP